MYKLVFANGTELDGLERLNLSTFEIKSNDSQIYWQLSEDNLAFATLYQDEELEEIFMDCMRASYTMQNGVIHFRITPIEGAKK